MDNVKLPPKIPRDIRDWLEEVTRPPQFTWNTEPARMYFCSGKREVFLLIDAVYNTQQADDVLQPVRDAEDQHTTTVAFAAPAP